MNISTLANGGGTPVFPTTFKMHQYRDCALNFQSSCIRETWHRDSYSSRKDSASPCGNVVRNRRLFKGMSSISGEQRVLLKPIKCAWCPTFEHLGRLCTPRGQACYSWEKRCPLRLEMFVEICSHILWKKQRFVSQVAGLHLVGPTSCIGTHFQDNMTPLLLQASTASVGEINYICPTGNIRLGIEFLLDVVCNPACEITLPVECPQ